MKENENEIHCETKDGKTLNINAIFDKLTDLGKARLELMRLKSISTTSEVASSSVANIVFLAFCGFTFLLLNVGIALYIGTVMGDAYFGFIILSGFYSFSAILYQLLFSKLIKTVIRNFFIKQLM